MINKCINSLKNYALTGCVSRINEDGLTAQQVIIKSAKRLRQCLQYLTNLAEGLKSYQIRHDLNYNELGEELAVTERVKIVIAEVSNAYNFYLLFSEDGKSHIELCGNINKGINEGLSFITELLPQLLEIDPTQEESLTELKTDIDLCYVDTYDECAMTLLELAGNTGKLVNDFIDVVNKLITFVDNFNLQLTYEEETISARIKGVSDEFLEL